MEKPKVFPVFRAKGIRGRKGDVILQLENGKIALPRGFTPQEWEWYYVEILEDRGRYAIVQLHQHIVGESGICVGCGIPRDYEKLKNFAKQWLENMLNKERVSRIKETKEFVIGRLDALINDLEVMIERLYKKQEPMRTVVTQICDHGIDSCFSYDCATPECVYIGNIIWSLEKLRDKLIEQRWAIVRALHSDRIETVTPLGIEKIFVP